MNSVIKLKWLNGLSHQAKPQPKDVYSAPLPTLKRLPLESKNESFYYVILDISSTFKEYLVLQNELSWWPNFTHYLLLLYAAKATDWILTPGANLSSLNEACTLPGELHISLIIYHVLVIHASNISLPD